MEIQNTKLKFLTPSCLFDDVQNLTVSFEEFNFSETFNFTYNEANSSGQIIDIEPWQSSAILQGIMNISINWLENLTSPLLKNQVKVFLKG